MTAANDMAVRRALDAAGVEFIDENGGGPGLRIGKAGKRKIREMKSLICKSACHLTPNRLPTATRVGRIIRSSIQCVAGRGLGPGPDLDADRTSDPTPNNSAGYRAWPTSRWGLPSVQKKLRD